MLIKCAEISHCRPDIYKLTRVEDECFVLIDLYNFF